MKALRFAAAALLVASLSPLRAGAQLDDGSPPDYVAVKAYLDRDAYRPGETARVIVELKIDPRVHINTSTPTEDYQFPTSLAWDDVADLESSAVSWPKGEMKAFEFTEGRKIGVYEGTVRATLSLSIPATAAPGARKLAGRLRAQGCTQTACYAPQTDEFELILRVVAAGEPTAAVNEDRFSAAAAPPAGHSPAGAGAEPATGAAAGPVPTGSAEGLAESVVQVAGAPITAAEAEAGYHDAAQSDDVAAAIEPEGEVASHGVPSPEDPAPYCPIDMKGGAKKLGGDKSMALVFLLTFLGGIGLAFTPCVLPLVPITIGFFARQQEGGRRPVVPALMYILGLALVYSAMGTLAALSGGLFGAALQQPAVLLGIAAILFALALSMFGLWDLNLPASLANRLGGGRAGNAGAMAMGGAMGLIAAPCVGPFVVSLLTYVAELGSRMARPGAALLGGSLFLVLALGLGLPFFLVALGAGSLRPGEWMVTVKKVFGFVILGVVLWFLRPLIGAPAFQWGLVVVLLAAGIYFLAHSRAPKHSPRARMGVVTVGVLSLVAMLGWTTSVVMTQRAAQGTVHGFDVYSEDVIERAAMDGRPMVLDFSATWCIACVELEHRTFPDERVQEKLRQFVPLRADLSKDTPETERIYKKWGIVGLPAIVFLDSGGKEIEPLRLEEFETADEFLVRLDCALAVDVASR